MEMINYKFGGYGRYFDEMKRLDQVGMTRQFKTRKLEGSDVSKQRQNDSNGAGNVRGSERTRWKRED
jgi:hypothetical protein